MPKEGERRKSEESGRGGWKKVESRPVRMQDEGGTSLIAVLRCISVHRSQQAHSRRPRGSEGSRRDSDNVDKLFCSLWIIMCVQYRSNSYPLGPSCWVGRSRGRGRGRGRGRVKEVAGQSEREYGGSARAVAQRGRSIEAWLARSRRGKVVGERTRGRRREELAIALKFRRPVRERGRLAPPPPSLGFCSGFSISVRLQT